MENFVYKPIIDAKLKYWLNERKKLPKNIKKSIPYKYPFIKSIGDEKEMYEKFGYINFDKYVETLYQSLDIPFINTITSLFIGKGFVFPLTIHLQKSIIIVNSFFFQIDEKTEEYKNKILVKDFGKFIDALFDFSNDKPFFVIDVTIDYGDQDSDHQTVIFCEREETKKILYLSYYDPHGYRGIKRFGVIPKMLKKIQKVSGNTILTNYKLSELGIQIITKDEIGFCVMFSCFWIYIIFSIIFYNVEKGTYITSNNWIDKVENYYNNLLNPGELYDSIVSFSYYFYEKYFVDNVVNVFEEQKKHLQQFLSTSTEEKDIKLDERRKNYQEIKQPENESLYSKSQLKKLRKINPELTYESWEKRRLKELNKIKKVKNEIKRRKALIGDQCLKDQDCFSGKCKITQEESYCIP
jgi:hypothetical protein